MCCIVPVQGVLAVLPVRVSPAGGSDPGEGPGRRVQVPKQYQRVVLYSSEERRERHCQLQPVQQR